MGHRLFVIPWRACLSRGVCCLDIPVSGETYVRVTGMIETRTTKAVKFNNAWIPRFCIHGADEREIDKHEIGDEIELRMFDWVAEREGFL